MRRARGLKVCFELLICCCVLVPGTATAQAVANKQAILTQARQSYYNLRTQGMATFQCDVTPNWELLLKKERAQNPEGVDNAVKTLSQLRFVVSMAADNSVKLTHNELTGENEQMTAALAQIYGGMEQMASGFFDTWKLFMVSPPFPEINSEYQLETVGDQYRLTYKEDNANVVTSMGRDFGITDMHITTPEFDSSIQPTFVRTSKGWRLSGYQASYQSQKPEEATRLKVSIDYQEVAGFSMLQKLGLTGSYGGAPFAVELAFSACQATRQSSANSVSSRPGSANPVL